MSLRSEMIVDAKLIMRDGLLRTSPGVSLDERSYVDDWRSNLLSGIDPASVEADLRNGKGSELDQKFRAAHSSAALAVNAFGPFRSVDVGIPIPGVGNVAIEQFERTFSTGITGRTPPHLDVAARGDRGVVAIESKCLEYLTRKAASFAPAYQSLSRLRDTPWFAEMERLRADPRCYEALDAAQLVKHAFGLLNSAGEGATLVYLYWEPDDAEHHDLFLRHRQEIVLFEERTGGGDLRFIALSYPELWQSWREGASRSLAEHANRLHLRYGGTMGSYEGYVRTAGRKTDAGFFGNLN